MLSFTPRHATLLTAVTLMTMSGCGGGDKTSVTDNPVDPVEDTDPCDFEKWGQGIYHFKCYNDTDNWWEKDGLGDPYKGPWINACVSANPNNPDPTEGGDWESKAKKGCSSHCEYLAGQNGVDPYQCSKDNWFQVDVTPGHPAPNCIAPGSVVRTKHRCSNLT